MPNANGVVGGPWSSVPLWRGLDSAFLCEPAIPKAPPTPRFRVDEVVASPPLQNNPFISEQSTQPIVPNAAAPKKAPLKMLIVSAAIGFIGGMLMAWCGGLLG